MYLQAGRPVRASRQFGDFFDVVGGFFESDFGGAILKVGTGLATTWIQAELGPHASQQPGQPYFPLYAPYSAQPGTVPQNVAAITATTQQQAAVLASSTAQDFTPWIVAGAVVLVVLVLK